MTKLHVRCLVLALTSAAVAACGSSPPVQQAPLGATEPTEADRALDAGIATADAATPAAAVPEVAVVEVPPDAAPPCAWSPDQLRSDTSAAWPERAGCYLAPADQTSLAHVARVQIVAVEVGAKATTVQFVLLNVAGERVVPTSGKLRYEVELRKKVKASVSLAGLAHRDGIFSAKLKPNSMPQPCEVLIRLEIDGSPSGAAVVDEWRPYMC